MENRFSIYNISKQKVGNKVVKKESIAFEYNFRNLGHAVAFARISYASKSKETEDIVVMDGNKKIVFSARRAEFFED